MSAKRPKDDYGDVQWNMGTLFTMVSNIEENVGKIMQAQKEYSQQVERDYATKLELEGLKRISEETRKTLRTEIDPIKEQFERTQRLLGAGTRVSKWFTIATQTILTSTLTLLVAYYFNKYFS